MADRPMSIAQHFHERTKYDPETVANNPYEPDWNHPPDPFKEYRLGKTYDLKAHLMSREAYPNAEEHQWRRLSRLLFCTYGLTLRLMTQQGNPVYLRAAPSAGGLYPAEVYLISRGTPLLPAGLYHYEPQTHRLLNFWESESWTELQTACFWHPSLDQTQMALVITAIFQRSAWRYQDRAYRRIFLDSGHVLGNVELAAAMTDFRPHLIGGFVDEAVNELLYLNPEQEGAIAIISLADRLQIQENLPLAPTALPSTTTTQFPNLSDGELLPYLHQCTQLTPAQEPAPLKPIAPPVALPPIDKYNFPFCLKVSTVSPPLSWGEHLDGLEKTMLQRRSTRAYSGQNLALKELNLLLDFTYQPQHYLDQDLDPCPDYFDLSLIQTFIAVSGVEGLEAGCYYYAPTANELRQIRFKTLRRELHMLCLWQNLGRDAGAVVFHTADLKQAVEKYGDRVYRYLHMDAGHLGQRLNLAAIQLGLGVSGIGGFFDNQVNDVLGIPPDEAVLYLTTLGRPV